MHSSVIYINSTTKCSLHFNRNNRFFTLTQKEKGRAQDPVMRDNCLLIYRPFKRLLRA